MKNQKEHLLLSNDVCFDTNGLIDLIIKGYSSPTVIGIEAKLLAMYPTKPLTITASDPEYLQSGVSSFDAQPQKPYITVTSQDIVPVMLFKRDAVPSTSDMIGWTDQHMFRFDVWGRTPPETKEVADGLKVALKRLQRELWSKLRVQLTFSGIVDAIGETGLPTFYHKYLTADVNVFQIMKEV